MKNVNVHSNFGITTYGTDGGLFMLCKDPCGKYLVRLRHLLLSVEDISNINNPNDILK